jgi:hypothetical protein
VNKISKHSKNYYKNDQWNKEEMNKCLNESQQNTNNSWMKYGRQCKI